MTPPTFEHRRASDRWSVRASTFTRTVLPPILATYFAGLVGHTVEYKHAMTWENTVVIAMCLAAAFGPTMFRDWISHKENLSSHGATG